MKAYRRASITDYLGQIMTELPYSFRSTSDLRSSSHDLHLSNRE